MARVAIVTDSAADLPPDLTGRESIHVLPFTIRFGGQAYRDRDDLSADEFHARLSLGVELPVTEAPTRVEFERTYRELTEQFDGVVSIHVSSRLANAVTEASAAAELLSGKLPVEVVDSLNVSLGLGFQVHRAAELAQTGRSASDIATELRSDVSAYHLLFFVDTLDYLKRGGRIGTAATIIGSLLHLKPVLQVEEGLIVPYERARTKSRAIGSLREFVASWPEINRLGVLYTSDRPSAEQLAAEIGSTVSPDRVVIAQLGPMLSAQVGPDLLGVCVDAGRPD